MLAGNAGGLCSSKKSRLPSRAAPLRVCVLVILHSILRESTDYWDRLFAGCCLFCVYARARWSDAQHAGEFQVDSDQKTGRTAFFEAIVEVHKTMNRKGKDPVCLELVSPGLGVTFDDWVKQFLAVREKLGISRSYPLMPAPNNAGEPTIRALASDECSSWLQKLLPERGEMPTTSHSLKSTALSYCAKYGLSHVDRLALGGHSHPYKISDTYARDALARPLRLLAEVLEAIREKFFFPDESRAGRFKDGIRLGGWGFPGRFDNAHVPKTKATEIVSADAHPEPESLEERDSLISHYTPSLEPSNVGSEEEDHKSNEPSDSGHTSSSSRSSSPSSSSGSSTRSVCRPIKVPPVPPEGHRFVQHPALKTLHYPRLEHVLHTLCSRKTEDVYKEPESVRATTPVCRNCQKILRAEIAA